MRQQRRDLRSVAKDMRHIRHYPRSPFPLPSPLPQTLALRVINVARNILIILNVLWPCGRSVGYSQARKKGKIALPPEGQWQCRNKRQQPVLSEIQAHSSKQQAQLHDIPTRTSHSNYAIYCLRNEVTHSRWHLCFVMPPRC